MNPLDELNKLDAILEDWSPHGPADERYFHAKDIVREIDTEIETMRSRGRPFDSYAASKIGALQSDLNDLFYRDGKNSKRVASFASLLESTRRYVAILQSAFAPASQ